VRYNVGGRSADEDVVVDRQMIGNARSRLSAVWLAGLLVALSAAGVRAQVGGWDYLIDKLVADGVPRDRAVRTFSDPRMPAFDGLPFGLDPREPTARYRNFRTEAAAQAARRCYAQHADVLTAAERTHGVPGTVVAAIMYVETGCGRNLGSSRILHRLARLAMANEPANLRWNIERHAAAADGVTAERVRTRARYLEDTFYPEVLATFAVADRLRYDPLEIRGSGSGAFGNPQFLPSSYMKHGDDGDGDGYVDLFRTPDAAASCARYLASFGWTPASTDADKRRVIWHYNRSDAYVDTVLLLANRIQDPDYQVAAARPAATRRTVARRKATAKTTARKASTRKTSAKASTTRGSTKKTAAKASTKSTARKSTAKSTAKAPAKASSTKKTAASKSTAKKTATP
jgi:membrane-bound lytic murein transglycosylase B